MALVKTSVTFSPGVSHYEVYYKPATSTAPYKFVGLFAVTGVGTQSAFFNIPAPIDIKIKIVPICCDGCEGTPFEFLLEANDITTTVPPSTTIPPSTTTLPPTTTLPTTTVPPANRYDLCISASRGGGTFPVFLVQAFNGVPAVPVVITRMTATGFNDLSCNNANILGTMQLNQNTPYLANQSGQLSVPYSSITGNWFSVSKVTVSEVEIQGIGPVVHNQEVNIGTDIVTIKIATCVTQGNLPCTPDLGPYDFTGYSVIPELMNSVSYPTNQLRLRFRRPLRQGNDQVRVDFRYVVRGATIIDSFEWTDNTTIKSIIVTTSETLFSVSDIGDMEIVFVEVI